MSKPDGKVHRGDSVRRRFFQTDDEDETQTQSCMSKRGHARKLQRQDTVDESLFQRSSDSSEYRQSEGSTDSGTPYTEYPPEKEPIYYNVPPYEHTSENADKNSIYVAQVGARTENKITVPKKRVSPNKTYQSSEDHIYDQIPENAFMQASQSSRDPIYATIRPHPKGKMTDKEREQRNRDRDRERRAVECERERRRMKQRVPLPPIPYEDMRRRSHSDMDIMHNRMHRLSMGSDNVFDEYVTYEEPTKHPQCIEKINSFYASVDLHDESKNPKMLKDINRMDRRAIKKKNEDPYKLFRPLPPTPPKESRAHRMYYRQNTQPPSPPGYDHDPLMVRELGLSPELVSEMQAKFLRSCIAKACREQIANLSVCTPMPVYTLSALAEPSVAKRALRIQDLVPPIVRITVLTNYYIIGRKRLEIMLSSISRFLDVRAIEDLKARAQLAICDPKITQSQIWTRFLGRSCLSNTKFIRCRNLLEKLLPQADPDIEESQRTESDSLICRNNGLMPSCRYSDKTARYVYAQNLAALEMICVQEPILLRTASAIDPSIHPKECSAHDVELAVNDLLFMSAIANMLTNFEASLEESRLVVLMAMEDLTELLHFVYLQINDTKNDYRDICNDIAREAAGGRKDGSGLAIIVRKLVSILQTCYNSRLFICPRYIQTMVRSVALKEAGYPGMSFERAAKALANPELHRPSKRSSSNENQKDHLNRNISYHHLELQLFRGNQIPSSTVACHAPHDLFSIAARKLSKSGDEDDDPDTETSAANEYPTSERRASIRRSRQKNAQDVSFEPFPSYF